MSDERSPTLRRRELGHRLRELRQGRDLTLEQVAERLLFSSAKLSRLETGARGATLRDIRDLCTLYEVGDEEHAQLVALARQSKERAWWQEYDLPYRTYVGLEHAASAISEYNPATIPGLLQTKEYATALIEGMGPKLDSDEVARRVEVKLTRQQVLQRQDPPQLWVVVDEAALVRTVGSTAVMRAQLTHLATRARSAQIHVQVMPFEAGAHPGLNSNFILLELGNASKVVYVEGLHGHFYLEKPSDIERYRGVLNQLRATALGPRESIALIENLLTVTGPSTRGKNEQE